MNRLLEWIVSGVIGAIIGMIITYSWSYHLFPLLNSAKAKIFGDTISFTATPGMTAKLMAKHFTEEMAEPGELHYVVRCDPEAESIILANTEYRPQSSYSEMVKHIVERNRTLLKYYEIEDEENPQIFICASTQNCEKIVMKAIGK